MSTRSEEVSAEVAASQQGGDRPAACPEAHERGTHVLAEVREDGEGAAEEGGERGRGAEEDR